MKENAACEWCGRAIAQNDDGQWYAVKGEERGYDPLTCEASDDARHYPTAPVASAALMALDDLAARLRHAHADLLDLARGTTDDLTARRLTAKAEGVDLALSYVMESYRAHT